MHGAGAGASGALCAVHLDAAEVRDACIGACHAAMHDADTVRDAWCTMRADTASGARCVRFVGRGARTRPYERTWRRMPERLRVQRAAGLVRAAGPCSSRRSMLVSAALVERWRRQRASLARRLPAGVPLAPEVIECRRRRLGRRVRLQAQASAWSMVYDAACHRRPVRRGPACDQWPTRGLWRGRARRLCAAGTRGRAGAGGLIQGVAGAGGVRADWCGRPQGTRGAMARCTRTRGRAHFGLRRESRILGPPDT
jgi:hypothetical protein